MIEKILIANRGEIAVRVILPALHFRDRINVYTLSCIFYLFMLKS